MYRHAGSQPRCGCGCGCDHKLTTLLSMMPLSVGLLSTLGGPIVVDRTREVGVQGGMGKICLAQTLTHPNSVTQYGHPHDHVTDAHTSVPVSPIPPRLHTRTCAVNQRHQFIRASMSAGQVGMSFDELAENHNAGKFTPLSQVQQAFKHVEPSAHSHPHLHAHPRRLPTTILSLDSTPSPSPITPHPYPRPRP